MTKLKFRKISWHDPNAVPLMISRHSVSKCQAAPSARLRHHSQPCEGKSCNTASADEEMDVSERSGTFQGSYR